MTETSPARGKITVYLDADILHQLKVACAEDGLTYTALVDTFARLYLEEREAPAAELEPAEPETEIAAA